MRNPMRGLVVSGLLVFIGSIVVGCPSFIPNQPPEASFSVSISNPPVGQLVTFNASDAVDSATINTRAREIVKYEWDFGDGSTASGKRVSHRYTSSGSYPVTLTVTYDEGETDAFSRSVEATAKIYWAANAGKIQRSNLDGSNVETLVSGVTGANGIDVDVQHGKIYWTNFHADMVQRANIDGSNKEDLVTRGLTSPRGIDLDVPNGEMYWVDSGISKIQKANLDGSNVRDVLTSVQWPFGFALDLDERKMYWVDFGIEKVFRANMDGSSMESIVDTPDGLTGLALDLQRDKVYWANRLTDKIRQANLDGTDVKDVVTTGLTNTRGIALDVDGNKMFWADDDTGEIKRAELDGTNIKTIISGLDGPWGMALAD